MSELKDDEWLRRFWPDCPQEVVDRIDDYVLQIATESSSPHATDEILPDACNFSWYKEALLADQQQFHKLVGHFVRVARDYEVARTPSGRPRKLPSESGPHQTFTEQVPRRTSS